ncbi:MAG: hypothetical protein HQ513_19015, partial [Rhodospirillales bacterium]|nr:hypothetical protein [Rhodospirillales bacterium]
MKRLLLLAVIALSACQATVRGQAVTSLSNQPQATVEAIPLKVGLYVSPAVRRYSVDEGWARFNVGQDLEATASEIFPRTFNAARPLGQFPDPSGGADDLDLVVMIERPDSNFGSGGGTFEYKIQVDAPFSIHLPSGELLRTIDTHSELIVTMGSLDPSENIKAAYKGFEIIIQEVVTQFLRDFPRAEMAARVKAAGPRVADTAGPREGKADSETPRFPSEPIAVTFSKVLPRHDDIAVIIGNADYGRQGKDIPDITPAYADAASFKRYAIEGLGIR